MTNDEYLTATQARKEMGISTVKLRQMLDKEELPFVRNPRDKRQKLIRRSDVEAWKRSAAGFPPAQYTKHKEECTV